MKNLIQTINPIRNILMVLLLGNSMLAQPSKLWDKTFGSSGDDVLVSAIALSDGSIVLGGNSNGGISGDKSAVSRGGKDFWIIKIDASGNKLWDASFGGSEDETLKRILPHQGGGYMIFGESRSGISGNKTAPKLGDRDVWLVKISDDGVREWDRSYGSIICNDLFRFGDMDIQATPDGGYWMIWTSLDNCPDDFPGCNSVFMEIDATGNVLAEKNKCLSFRRLIPTKDGNFLILYEQIAADFKYVAKFDPLLNTIWRTRRLTTTDVVNHMIQSPLGNYLLIGSYDAVPNFGSVKELDAATGTVINRRTYGGDHSPGSLGETFNSAAEYNDGSVVVLGTTGSPIPGGYVSEPSRGGDDFWVINTEQIMRGGVLPAGRVLWEGRFGGANSDKGQQVLTINSNQLLLAGTSDSNSSGDKSQNSRGGRDYWVIMLLDSTPSFIPPIFITELRGIIKIPPLPCEAFDWIDRPIPCDWVFNPDRSNFGNFNITPNYAHLPEVGSVSFKMNGELIRVDDQAPFHLFNPDIIENKARNTNLDFGIYDLEIVAYDRKGGKGKIIESITGKLLWSNQKMESSNPNTIKD